MSQGAYTRRVMVLLTLCIAMALGTGWLAAATEEEDILPVIQSFQRLGMIDPAAAGSVWMTEESAVEWSDFVRQAGANAMEGIALFGHGYWLTGFGDDGMPFGGLYNPWIGSLIVLEMDRRAVTINRFLLFTVESEPILSLDSQALATDLMARIERADERFADLIQTDLVSDSDAWSEISSRIDDYVPTLGWIYGASPDGSSAQANAQTAIDRFVDGPFDGALSLLRREDPAWLARLFPVYAEVDTDETFVVFSSTESPLDLVSMTVAAKETDDPIRSLSVIRLFDRLTKRGGEDS